MTAKRLLAGLSLPLLLVVAVPPAPARAQAQRRATASTPSDELAAGREITEQELRGAPGARDVWALLEHRMPTVISERLDVGGSETGTQGLFSSRSTSWRENVYRLGGIDVTDPAVRGTSAFYYDHDALERLGASWGTRPADVAGAGVAVDLAIRRGGQRWHGAAQGYIELDALQADNLSDELAAQGVPPAAQIDYLSDLSGQLGGPLAGEGAAIFASYRDRRISRAVAGFDEPVTTSMPVLTVKLDARPGGADDLDLLFSWQRYRNPARNAGRSTAPEATLVEDSSSIVLGGGWLRAFDGGTLRAIEARGAYLDIDLPLTLQPGATRQSRRDIVTGLRSGSAPLQIESSRRRSSGEAQVRLQADGASARHDIGAGVQFAWAPTRTDYAAIDDVNIVTGGGGALVAQLLNTPVNSRQSARALGLWLHDDLGLGARWTLSVGLRYDDWSGSLPEQTSPAGTYAAARSFAARDGVIGWRGLAPRAALSFDVRGDGRLIATFGYAHYLHQMSTSTVRFGNANAPAVSVVPWADANGDGQFQPGEGGAPVTVAGGAAGDIDADLSAPLTRELRAGLALELGGGWRGSADFWYRVDDRLLDDVEVGLTDADFAPTTVRDPGRDNLLGTDDDAGMVVFNQVESFGDNRRLLTNVADKEVTYRGLDLLVQRPWAGGWTVRAALTLGLAEGASGKSGLVPGDPGVITDLFDDPNADINAGIGGDARTFWDRPYVLKLFGSYELPRGFILAGVLRSWAGAPIGRILPVPLNQGIVNVWAEPRGVRRESALTTADVRLAKDFDVARGADLSLYLDLFNVTNAATVTRTHETFPRFGVPAEIIAPFVARIGAGIAF